MGAGLGLGLGLQVGSPRMQRRQIPEPWATTAAPKPHPAPHVEVGSPFEAKQQARASLPIRTKPVKPVKAESTS